MYQHPLILPQPQPIVYRHLEQQVEFFKNKFSGRTIPLPNHWGGYRVVPHRMEFWQGRENRLHDRLVYIKSGADWKRERLAP